MIINHNKKYLKYKLKYILQKGNAVSSNDDELNLMTFNIFNYNCRNLKIKINEILISENFKPHLICTQEEHISQKHFVTNNDMTYIFTGYKSIRFKDFLNNNLNEPNLSYNKVGVHYLTDISCEEIETTEKETYEKYKDLGYRYGLIATYKNIRIANVHLEGGGYYDSLLNSKDFDFEEYLNHKLLMLIKIISLNPDIIVGDFNSVYSEDQEILNGYLEKQYEYFKKEVFKRELTNDEKKNIKDLNSAPYDTLKKFGYIYAIPENEGSLFTSHLGESIVDCIWYKKEKVTMTICRIVDVFKPNETCISDHNPVIATFKLIPSLECKEINQDAIKLLTKLEIIRPEHISQLKEKYPLEELQCMTQEQIWKLMPNLEVPKKDDDVVKEVQTKSKYTVNLLTISHPDIKNELLKDNTLEELQCMNKEQIWKLINNLPKDKDYDLPKIPNDDTVKWLKNDTIKQSLIDNGIDIENLKYMTISDIIKLLPIDTNTEKRLENLSLNLKQLLIKNNYNIEDLKHFKFKYTLDILSLLKK